MILIDRTWSGMFRNVWHLSLIITSCSACVFGAFGKKTQQKRSQSAWYTERFNHAGLGLSDLDLQKVAELGDEKHFNDTLTSILIPRVVDTPGHVQVRQFIIDQMENLGWTVENHSFEDQTPVGVKTFTNVIATLNPSATRRLVIACHYDSKLTPKGFLGATDSAVPCSMMINLAHVLQSPLNQHKQKRQDLTLQFLFIDGEEAFERWTATDSLYGARKLASKLHSTQFPPGSIQDTTELHRIDLFVLLDLIGTKDCKFFSYFEDSELWYARLSSFEKRMMSSGLVNNNRDPMFREQSYYGARIEDDHVPFLKKGVPVLHLIPAPFPSVWHKMSDNRESLHPPSIENLNTLMRAFVVDYLHLSL